MRRFLSIAAFSFGAYNLWFTHDRTIELVAMGAMGVALLLEFMAPD